MSTETKEMSFSELIKGDTPVLVDFYTDWCAPCKMMIPVLDELKKMMGDDLIIIKIDAEKNADAAIKYQVRGVPTLMLFQQGYVLWREAGVKQAQYLKQIIDSKRIE